MTADRRRLPFDGTTALNSLLNVVEASQFTGGEHASLGVPVAPLWRSPAGRLDKDLIYGEPLTIIIRGPETSFVQSGIDGYCGYTPTNALTDPIKATHRVTSRSTHLYPEPDFKAAPRDSLSCGSLVQVQIISGAFAETPKGWLPLPHLSALDLPATDPVAIAESFLATPYLWGGNTGWGIDCSGLVQIAHLVCGVDCPRDSDMQEAEFGTYLLDGAPLRRGDLVFWKGHVGMMRDSDTLLHANAHHMMTASEPLSTARARITAKEFGAVTAFKRPA
ncbi:MAG: cell wall-associated NlpC family hydrolase [Dinoroseobacter sp.]|jgi:cell wall-associated NlpC family hydrolase